jgi:hypothetical protein
MSNQSLSSAALGQALAAPNASLMSATPTVAGPGSDATSTSSQLSNALAKLAIVQNQQQQQQQQLQQQVAANAILQAAASGASSLLPSVPSNMSLGNLKSSSVTSSVMSGLGLPLSQLEPIPSSAPTSASTSSSTRVSL